jgi:ParB family chromosome partitioning protein
MMMATVAAVPVLASAPLPVFEVAPWASIQASTLNPRKSFDRGKLEDLARSMAHGVGIIEPLIVRQAGKRGAYELVAGERRWRAAEIAGLTEVPVIVKVLTDVQVLELMVIENNQREDINALEEADGFRKLTRLGVGIDTIATRLGRSRKYIYDRLKLFDLVPTAQQLLLADRITAGHAILLARLTKDQQAAAIDPGGDHGPMRRSPLFEYEAAALTHAECDAQETAAKTDPYVGLKAKSVRELDHWISDHCRFDPKTRVNQELFAETARAVETAAKVVQITENHYTQPEAKEGNAARIYHGSSWKRADGLLVYAYGRKPTPSKTCAKSVLGVIVAGPGRGQAFAVCVDKDCDVHWKAERLAREKAASGDASAQSRAAARQQAFLDRYAAQRKKEQDARVAWQQAAPQVRQALQAKVVAGAPVAVLAAIVGDHYGRDSGDWRPEAIKAAGAPKTADAWLRVLALAVVLALVDDDWSGPRELPAIAKALGVNLAQVLKKAAVQTSAPAAKASVKTARKKR